MSLLKRALRRILSTPVSNRQKVLIFQGKAKAAGLYLRSNGPYFDLERGVKVLRISASHALYIPGMIEHFDYFWNSVVPVKDIYRQIVDMSGRRHHELIGFGD